MRGWCQGSGLWWWIRLLWFSIVWFDDGWWVWKFEPWHHPPLTIYYCILTIHRRIGGEIDLWLIWPCFPVKIPKSQPIQTSNSCCESTIFYCLNPPFSVNLPSILPSSWWNPWISGSFLPSQWYALHSNLLC